MENKESLRRRLLALRDLLEAVDVRRMSRRIYGQVIDSGLLDSATGIALYSPIRNEVDTGDLLQEILRSGRRAYYPRLEGERMVFVEVADKGDFSVGRWGLPEPHGRPQAGLDGIDLFLLPAVGFDEEGYRLGFGKGYYDRALEGYRGMKAGLAYDFQVVSDIFRGEKDLRCWKVFTEGRVLTAPGC